MKIGVLALQGDFSEHIQALHRLSVDTVEVRLPEDLDGIDGLIIPGGESTTIGKLATTYGLIEPLRSFVVDKPVWGTCAGMIFLAKDVGMAQPLLGVMDIAVDRNAFGRQIDSFETDLDISQVDGGPFHTIFIRGPLISRIDDPDAVEVLAKLDDGRIVAARQGHCLVTAFHPELTDDDRIHALFVKMVKATA